MKRTLVEVTCGLAALVVMISFHRQITRLEVQNNDVGALRTQVEEAFAASATEREQHHHSLEMIAAVQNRIQMLEQELTKAAAGSDLANALQSQLQDAQSDVEVFRSQIVTDFERTKALVDAYISEVRIKERNAAVRMSETRDHIATLAGQLHRDHNQLTRSMLLPTVQLNGDDTVGSGTLVWSDVNPQSKDKEVESYVLTSYHVVRNILADTPRARHDGIEVTIYQADERVNVRGRMVASNPKIDAALVKLDSEQRFPNVANVMPADATGDIEVWDPVCAVGCPLGNDPVPTQGEVSSLQNELNGANYWMINAPTYFGNSGGGVYKANTHQLIGVFSKIYTHGKGNPVVIPHMGLCTPISTIYTWLGEEGMGHLLRSQPVQLVDFGLLAAPPK